MVIEKLAYTQEELEEIAGILLEETKQQKARFVSRHIRIASDSVYYQNGIPQRSAGTTSNLNLEDMSSQLFSETSVDHVRPDNFEELTVARDLQRDRFRFKDKGIQLPADRKVFFHPVPGNFEIYDEELRQFSKDHPNTRLTRDLNVDQRVIVNSEGGVAIQSLPFVSLRYSHGYEPIPVFRDISVLCTSEEAVRKIDGLREFLPDPTVDRKLQRASSLLESLHGLYELSRLKFGSLEEAGIPLSVLYDLVVLNGIPVHEIFGHHFEEPLRYLEFGESGTFKQGQNIQNTGLTLEDDPNKRINGLHVLGFTHFDSYGRPREKRIHIKDGKVQEFLGSEYVDQEGLAKFLNMPNGSSYVGNAVQPNDGLFPDNRMSCTVLDGTPEDVDLEGKIVLVSSGGHTNPAEKTYLIRAPEAYIIKNGVPRRILPLQVTGGINQALANISLLSRSAYQTGMCTKPDPLKGRYGSRVPVSQFAKSQVWTAQQVYPLPVEDRHVKILTESI